MACNQCFCLACVRTNTVALVERCGKFQAIKGPGCQCLVWPVDSIVGRVSLRVRQLDVNCETKTKDNVFVNVVISVQYQVVDREPLTRCSTSWPTPRSTIRVVVSSRHAVGAAVKKMELDDMVFVEQGTSPNQVEATTFDRSMMSFGEIIKALVRRGPDSLEDGATNRPLG